MGKSLRYTCSGMVLGARFMTPFVCEQHSPLSPEMVSTLAVKQAPLTRWDVCRVCVCLLPFYRRCHMLYIG